MKFFDEVGAYVAEDGAKFFSFAEAKAHEEMAYIAKSLQTYGHAEVTAALNEVEKLYPEARKMVSAMFNHLRYRQAGTVVTDTMARIESYLAPANIAKKVEDLFQGGETVPAEPVAQPPVEPPAPDTTSPTEPPAPPSEPERVQKPDVHRTDPSDAHDAGTQAVADAVDPSVKPQPPVDVPPPVAAPPLTRADLDDAVPPYIAPEPTPAPEVAAPGPFPAVVEQPPGGVAPANAGGSDPIAAMRGIVAVEAEKAQNGS